MKQERIEGHGEGIYKIWVINQSVYEVKGYEVRRDEVGVGYKVNSKS